MSIVPRADAARPVVKTGDAFDLLGEVADLLPTLAAKCSELEATIGTHEASLRDDLATIADVALQWQRLAQDLKQQVQHLTEATADCRRRAEEAETEAEALALEAERTNQASAKATALNARFEQTILSAFGSGSAGRAALEAMDRVRTVRTA